MPISSSLFPNALDERYTPSAVESYAQDIWRQAQLTQNTKHHTKNQAEDAAQPYAIFLPPPNITGTLHMGHAFNQTIMDVLIRHARMQGKDALWLPGLDHAGIATQIVVERQLAQKGIDAKSLSRETFLQHVHDWRHVSSDNIRSQTTRLGSSLDWARGYFTMDETMSKAVIQAFVKLHDDGFIYRGERLVNWDPSLQTAVSDLEVSTQEEQGHLWHIRYPLAHDATQYITVATTRPETLLGDVAVMVHPDDERYRAWIGQDVWVPIANRRVPIIADTYVDATFGTGAVKVTPAHDFNDHQVAKRHGLPMLPIFDLHARCNHNTPENYQGLDRFAAREKILQDLSAAHLLVKTQPHTLMIPRCERTQTIVEPMLTHQWFMDLTQKNQHDGQGHCIKKGGWDAITQPALHAVQSGAIQLVPDEWRHTYSHWLENIQDWCLSRQLWWGHQIPAWYTDDGQIFVAEDEAKAYNKAKASGYQGHLRRDSDVLDTWFSSALVPFAALGWSADDAQTQAKKLYQHFLPSCVLVTGYDIIFFWVARMVMMTQYFTGTKPFDTVYVHGLVRDAEGKKMSKSEGNTLDPLDLMDGIELDALLLKRSSGLRRPELAPHIEQKTRQQFPHGIPSFGTDALRFTFASLATLGRSINFDSGRCDGYVNFCNKLWNAARFVRMQLEQNKDVCSEIDWLTEDWSAQSLDFVNAWLIDQLKSTSIELEQHIQSYRFDLMAQKIYTLLWDEYCDWYLEAAKVALQSTNQTAKKQTLKVLVYGLQTILRFLHPIMPFITEALWSGLAPSMRPQACLGLSPYPHVDDFSKQDHPTPTMQLLKDWVYACRQLRAQLQLPPQQKLILHICVADDNAHVDDVFLAYLKVLAKLERAERVDNMQADASTVMVKNSLLRFDVVIDVAEKTAQIEKELNTLTADIEKIQQKLGNPGFVAKAPAQVVAQERTRLDAYTQRMGHLQLQLGQLGG